MARSAERPALAAAPGKRERNKLATRSALRDAANRLFDERGFRQTTVRDIAQAAGVTERTFFRYFASKQELVVDEALSWLPRVQQEIRARPPEEPPFVAVREALRAVGGVLGGTALLWPYQDGPPAARLSRASTFQLTVEQALADAVAERLAPARRDGGDTAFEADVVARTIVALMRTALIHDHRLRQSGAADRPTPGELLDQALARLPKLLDEPMAPRRPS